MNYAIEVYAAARKPHYPQIDSIGFYIHSRRFIEEILPACQQNIAFEVKTHPVFYSAPMAAVKALLDVNDRRQSIDYEPLCSIEIGRHILRLAKQNGTIILIQPF